MNFDFHPDHIDANQFLTCIDSRSVRHENIGGEVLWSIDAMTDDDLKEAIVEDVLGITMWEIQTGNKLVFNFEEMTRFLLWNEQHERVAAILKTEQVQRFVEQIEGEYRIRNSQEVRQAAMDYCGVWYCDYKMGDDVIVTNSDTRDNIAAAIEKAGSIENLAISLSMDLEASHIHNHQLN